VRKACFLIADEYLEQAVRELGALLL